MHTQLFKKDTKVHKKTKVHRHTESQKVYPKKNRIIVWERYFSDNKYECIITLDKAYFYQDYWNETRKNCLLPTRKILSENWLIKYHEN